MKKYNILILSNRDNDEFLEDTYIADAFRKDGHVVDMLWVDYDELLDKKYDVIIRRNTWVEDENKTVEYYKKNNELKERLTKKNIKTVNLIGLDGNGKEYLCRLYKDGKKVIPTVNNIEDIKQINDAEEYVIKDNKSFGSGIGQKIVVKDKLTEEYMTGYLIQPKIKFKSEVQCYFVANELLYVFEYTPSKYPTYPEPVEITLTEEQKKLVCDFARESNLKVGFQRIDFLRLENDELLLLEIEDNSPHMNLTKLDTNFRNEVLNVYKKNVYEYLEE